MKPIEYICTFSTLGQLQAAHQYRYRLTPQTGGFLMQLESRGLPCSRRCCLVLDCPAAAAQNLLRLLYENAVPPEGAAALARDLLPDAVRSAENF